VQKILTKTAATIADVNFVDPATAIGPEIGEYVGEDVEESKTNSGGVEARNLLIGREDSP